MLKGIMMAVVAIGAGTSAQALEVLKSADIPAPPAKVWKTIAEFCSIGEWHPAVEKCERSEKDGKVVRTLNLKGGGTIVEERIGHSDERMDYSYKIIESPLPVADYTSTIAVTSSAGGSKVTWKGWFKAKGAGDSEAKEVIGKIYEAGFKGISEKAK